MRDQAVDKATGGGAGRQPHRQRPARDRTAPRGLPGAQASLGNAGVVQMLRMAGHPWAQDRHRHGPGCGHRAPAPSGGLGTPAVQRRISVRGPQSATPEGMSSAGDVKEFLSRHRVSVATEYAARTGVTEAVAAGVHYRLDATIDGMLHDSASRVYEDSESGARELAADICERIGPLAGATTGTPAGRASLGGAASPFAQRPLGPGRAPGRSAGPADGTTGAGRRTVMDALAGRAADAMADATPSTSVAEAALQGAAGAVTGRAGVLSGNLPALEDVRAGARLVAYLANEANISQADEMVERFATQSPAEGARVIQNWEDLKRVHATNFAVKQATSVGVGTLLGRVAGALIPGGGAVSMATGAASIGNSLAELGQGFKRFEQNNPQIGRAVRTHADHSLQRLSERSRETTMDVQMQSEWG